ncbi:putative F-box domain-containing protein [Tanacetum coccineum]
MCAHGDIVEQILARLDVDDIIRCKLVCKSWLSLISDPFFVKTHLIHSYNKDRKNNETRRIDTTDLLFYGFPRRIGRIISSKSCILGSSNGLVCLLTMDAKQILVANPSTRQVMQHLPAPPINVPNVTVLCCGFGYDFLTDDYKVIVGDHTGFQVLSLKTPVWKVIQVDYKFISEVGVLCNDALHWFVQDHNEKVVIVSFDLSKEEFKEIPQPDDSRYQWHCYHRLGIMNECLSICVYYGPDFDPSDDIWIMNNYNVKQSWKMLQYDCEAKRQVIHTLYEDSMNPRIPVESGKSFGQCISAVHSHRYNCAPIFVQSLVSLHVKARQSMNKRRKLSHTV